MYIYICTKINFSTYQYSVSETKREEPLPDGYRADYDRLQVWGSGRSQAAWPGRVFTYVFDTYNIHIIQYHNGK